MGKQVTEYKVINIHPVMSDEERKEAQRRALLGIIRIKEAFYERQRLEAKKKGEQLH